jgi:hypothetical protein
MFAEIIAYKVDFYYESLNLAGSSISQRSTEVVSLEVVPKFHHPECILLPLNNFLILYD